MKDYTVYSEDKIFRAVAINKVLFKYVRPITRYKRSDIVPVGKPVMKRSHAEAKKAADAWCGIVTKH